MTDFKYTNKIYSNAFSQQIDYSKFLQLNSKVQLSDSKYASMPDDEIDGKQILSNFEQYVNNKMKILSTCKNSRNVIKSS